MAPLADDFWRSGLTDDDLDIRVDQERQAIWDEKNNFQRLDSAG